MAAPADPDTDVLLCLIDAIDAEANAVTHAVIRADATVRAILSDARTLIDQPALDARAWAEASVRLLYRRAALVDALSVLCRTSREQSEVTQAPVTSMTRPLPAPADRADDVSPSDDVVVPSPPEARAL